MFHSYLFNYVIWLFTIIKRHVFCQYDFYFVILPIKMCDLTLSGILIEIPICGLLHWMKQRHRSWIWRFLQRPSNLIALRKAPAPCQERCTLVLCQIPMVKYRLSHHSVHLQPSKLLISRHLTPDSSHGAVLTRTTWRGEVNLEEKSCSPPTMTVEERGNAVPGKWRKLENCQISGSQSQLRTLPLSHWSKCPVPENSHTLQVTCKE